MPIIPIFENPYWLDWPVEKVIKFYAAQEKESANVEIYRTVRATLAKNDLFYLLIEVLGREDAVHPWIFQRCREVQKDPNDKLDLWAREHYKSTIITFALTIFDIIRNPEITVGIFSHTKTIARGFLSQIKQELERNDTLKDLFPDIFWEKPETQAPQWGLDTGITVKRKGNPKESTIEAWGLVDGQPTSKHFYLRLYDDVVAPESVTTPEQITKTTSGWQMSNNLGMEGGIERYAGTLYHEFDTYYEMQTEGGITARIHPCTSDGSEDFTKAVLMRPETLRKKRKKQGLRIFSTQMLLNPKRAGIEVFNEDHIQYWPAVQYKNLWRFAICDPASGKKKHNKAALMRQDYTSIWVIGYGADEKFYVIDIIRDKLALRERQSMLQFLHGQYKLKKIFYESDAWESDIEHFKYVKEQENYDMDIVPISTLGRHKLDRIKTLIPLFEDGRIKLPPKVIRNNWEGAAVDMVATFIREEYKPFPVLKHDDMLDALCYLDDAQIKIHLRKPSDNKQPYDALKAAAARARSERPVV